MKLRIFKDSLRFRLGPQDIQNLTRYGILRQSVAIGPGPDRQFAYQLSISELEEWQSSIAGSTIEIVLPHSLAHSWASGEEVGLSNVFDYDGSSLAVLIEKDFTCLIVREGADDSDTFPNPNADLEEKN